MSSIPIDLFKQAISERKASLLARVLADHPELKARINEPLFSFDSPAIVQAAGSGNRELVEILLEAGADLNARSLWWAGGFGVLDSADPPMADYLIGKGAMIDAHAAARLGMLEKLRELITPQPTLVHARGGDGKTPLHFASTTEIAEYLLANGAEIDALDIDHESTPAQHLVQSHPAVVRHLIRRGCRTDLLLAAAVGDVALVAKHLDADPECIRMRVNEKFFPKTNPRGGGTIYVWTLGMNVSAHQVARKFGHPEVLELLRDRSTAAANLEDAFLAGDEAEVKRLLVGQPDLIRVLTALDPSQICQAAQDNNTAAVRLLLQYDWPVDGGRSLTPLHWAAFHGNAEMTQELLRHNPPLESRDPAHHGTPLGWAIYGSEQGWPTKAGNYAEVVEALLQAGAERPAEMNGSEAVKEVLRRHGGT